MQVFSLITTLSYQPLQSNGFDHNIFTHLITLGPHSFSPPTVPCPVPFSGVPFLLLVFYFPISHLPKISSCPLMILFLVLLTAIHIYKYMYTNTEGRGKGREF